MHDSAHYDDGAFYYYCDLAVEYTEKHNGKKADECIREAARLTDGMGVLDEDPNYAHVYFEMGNIWGEKGSYERAIKHYEMAREEYSCYAEIAYDFADRIERLDNAIHCCVCIAAIDPGNAEAFLNMGIAYYSKEDYDQAIECYGKAIAIKPDYAEAYNNMGAACRFKEDYGKAIECYEKAVELNPKCADALNNMGIACADKGDYGKAIECYEKAAESDADKAKIAYYNMGNAYEGKKDWDKAIECWEKTIALDPDFREAYHCISLAYEAKGDKDKGLEHKEKAERAGCMRDIS